MTYCPQYDLGLLYIYNFAIFYKILVRRFGVPSKKKESNKKKRGQSRERQATQVGRVPSAAAPERRSGAGGAAAVASERRSGAGGAVAGAKDRSRRKS
jgi:hypothetical protein